MKITIEATPEEIAKLLQAIGSSKEQLNSHQFLVAGIKDPKIPEWRIDYDHTTGNGIVSRQKK